jgi:hypothetical protein
MDNAAYQALPAISSHGLIEMLKSPADCWQKYLDPMRPPQEASDAMRLGTAVHCLALTPRRFEQEIIVRHFERRSIKGKAAYAQMLATGKTPLRPTELVRAREIVAALQFNYDIRRLLRRGRPERTFIRSRGADLCPVRGRVDLHDARGKTIIELKTTRDLSQIDASIRQYRYALSAAFYRHWLPAQRVVMVFVESREPYRTRIIPLSDALLAEGDEQWRTALARFDACRCTNEWPEAESATPDLDDDPLMMPMPFMAAKANRQRFELPVGELSL